MLCHPYVTPEYRVASTKSSSSSLRAFLASQNEPDKRGTERVLSDRLRVVNTHKRRAGTSKLWIGLFDHQRPAAGRDQYDAPIPADVV